MHHASSCASLPLARFLVRSPGDVISSTRSFPYHISLLFVYLNYLTTCSPSLRTIRHPPRAIHIVTLVVEPLENIGKRQESREEPRPDTLPPGPPTSDFARFADRLKYNPRTDRRQRPTRIVINIFSDHPQGDCSGGVHLCQFLGAFVFCVAPQ